MAQLVERLVRNEKASGSNPLISTKKIRRNSRLIFLSIIVRTAEVSAVRATSVYTTPFITSAFLLVRGSPCALRKNPLIFLSIIVRTAELSALTLASSLFRRDAPYVQRHTYNHLQPLFYLPALNLMKKN